MRKQLAFRLTPRELEVARLVMDGLTDKEIAARLSVSRRTAEWHVKQIFNKLGFSSRAQVAAWMAREAAGGSGSQAQLRRNGNLPLPLTTFVGRERELVELRATVRSKRLITLSGVGGAGKTRLALELAGSMSPEFSDGTWMVDLSAVKPGQLVARAFGIALGVHERPRQPMAETLIEHLRSQRTLLVVDNCEQLVDDCAALAHEILRHCPDVTLLATSREALGVEGEVVYQIPPLEVPERQQNLDLVRLLKCESVDLFMDRARLVAPHFALDSETAGPVAELCRQLDGIPLAIELAAARIASMTPGQVLDRLSDRFSLLSAGPRTAPERHRTLRATLDWSHELLSETEATLFRHLAIFTGSFSLEAAEAVCAVGDVEVTSIPTHLGALTTKSLVMVKPGVEQTIRFRMLDTVHDFSLQKLAESGESLELAPRHCEFFLKFAEEAGPNLRGDRAAAWRTKLAEDLDNLRAALRWSAEHDHQANARLNVALVDVWHFHGLVQEGESWMVEALHSYDARDETRADLLRVGGQIAFWRADLSSTSSRCSESVDIYRELGRGKRFAVALAQVGQVAEWSGALESAHELYDEALVLARETHDDRGLETTLRFMGRLALVEGKHADVLEYLSQSISVDERTGDQRAKHWSLGYLALNAICIGDLDGARTHLEESLEIALSLDLSIGVASTLIYWATLEAALGRPIRAMRLAGAAHSIARSAGAAPMRLTKGVVDPWLEKSRRELGAEQSQACTDEGRLMSQERAVEYALEG